MKKYIAIPTIHPEYQLYQKGDTAYCTSLQVAEGLGKRHADVIRDIRKLLNTANSNQRKVSLVEDNQPNLRQSSNIDNAPNLALVETTDNEAHLERIQTFADFFKENFILTTYTDKKGEKRPMYLITQEGLTVLINNYTGEKALYFSILLSKRFKAMQEFIRDYILAKDEFPIFTQAIEDAYGEPNCWHFKNEIDMIYRIVLGMDAKHFREVHNIRQGESIRPYLTDAQYKAVRKLQAEDIRMLYRGIEYQDRKSKLSEYVLRSLPT